MGRATQGSHPAGLRTEVPLEFKTAKNKTTHTPLKLRGRDPQEALWTESPKLGPEEGPQSNPQTETSRNNRAKALKLTDTSQKFPANARGSGCSSQENYKEKEEQRAPGKDLRGPPRPALSRTEGLTGSEGTETREGKQGFRAPAVEVYMPPPLAPDLAFSGKPACPNLMPPKPGLLPPPTSRLAPPSLRLPTGPAAGEEK